MNDYLINLLDYTSVRGWLITIYDRLKSRSMPLTSEERQFWPREALETFRLCVNQRWRYDASTEGDQDTRIPKPTRTDQSLRVRQDVTSLTQAEIDDFRACLEDIIQVGNPLPDALWQK